jgi:hypothetical protein
MKPNRYMELHGNLAAKYKPTYTNAFAQLTEDMSTVSGAYGVGDPPVPIPNTEVKTHCGNNFWTTRSWQDSTAPEFASLHNPSGAKRRRG